MNCNKEERSKQIWVFRALAILSVCCAHMPANAENGTVDYVLGRLLDIYGTVGVGGFLLCSGYYFQNNEALSVKFWRKKVSRLVLPWLLLGLLVKGWYNYIGGVRPLYSGYWPWIMGNGNWLYFVPVLVELLILFTFARGKIGFAVIGILSILSNIMVILGLGYNNFYTPYMNPFNWAIFFYIGLLWKRRDDTKVAEFSPKYGVILCVAVLTLTLVVYGVTGVGAYYWTWISIPFELSTIFLLLQVSYYLRNSRILQDIGRNTLFIYIIHMIIAGGVMNHMPAKGVLIFLRPVVALIITYSLTVFTRLLMQMMHLDKLTFLVGMSGNVLQNRKAR